MLENKKPLKGGALVRDPGLEKWLINKYEENEKTGGTLGRLEVLGWIQKHDTTKCFLRLFLRRHGLTVKKGEKKRMKLGWDILLFIFIKRARWVTALYDARHVWNMDETGVLYIRFDDMVICRKGVRRVAGKKKGSKKARVTVVLCINAAGESIPPFYIGKERLLLST